MRDEWTLDEQRAAHRAVALLRAQQNAPGAITRDKDGKIPYQLIALPRRTIITNWVYRLVIIGVCLAIIALILLNIRPAVQETFFGATPQAQPTAPAYPTRAARLEYGGATDTGRAAPTVATVAYPLALPSSALAAWSPDQQPTLDVGGRRYRVLTTQPGATLAELDDGARVWLVEQAAPLQAAPAAAEPAYTPLPPPGPPDTWGEGGTTGGSTWGEPTVAPLQNAIIPAMPQLEAPTPTWGEGGSTGGSTW